MQTPKLTVLVEAGAVREAEAMADGDGWAVWIVHATRGGERRGVPLVGVALDLLRARHTQRRADSPLVFPSADPATPPRLGYWFRQACQAAGISDFRFHDLRHSAASYLAMDGASPSEIADLLGHKTLAMVKRYAHLSDGHRSGVVAKLNARLFG